MGHKINPKSLRLGITEEWSSKWMSLKNYKEFLEEDELIRDIISDQLRTAGVDDVKIERSGQKIRIIITSSRPGLVIGRSGSGVEKLRNMIEKGIRKLRKRLDVDDTFSLNIDVQEIRRSEISAAVIAEDIAQDLERRRRFRRLIRKQLEKIMQNKKVKGGKIRVSGRLDGSEIARSEWLSEGSVPLHTLRADIDYAEKTAYCSYGAVGIKVWVYKGDIFDEETE